MIALLLLAAAVQSSPDLGKAEGRCRANETGPAFVIDVDGLKDRKGQLKLEVYPANDNDFLQDDNILIMQGKVFRRVEEAVPPSGPATLCIRVPGPGTYALTLLHDRDSNHKFTLSTDGIAFSNNPRLWISKPKSAAVAVKAGAGLTRLHLIMNYRRGLMSFAPLGK